MITISQQQSQHQRLLPQQIQYQKLLQLPLIALEQEIREELELNPMLEEVLPDAADADGDVASPDQPADSDEPLIDAAGVPEDEEASRRDDDMGWQEVLAENQDEYDDGFKSPLFTSTEFDREDMPQRAADNTLAETLLEQLREQRMDNADLALAEEIVGNIDDHGYLTRDPAEIVGEVNDTLALESRRMAERTETQTAAGLHRSDEPFGRERLIQQMHLALAAGGTVPAPRIFTPEDAGAMLQRIQRLDPPGVGARDLRECLLIQIHLRHDHSEAATLATRVLQDCYDDFAAKRFERICHALNCTVDDLKGATDLIRTLNPKPGEGSPQPAGSNYVIPDFTVVRDGEQLVITFNDQNIPTLRISPSYKQMLKDRRNGGLNSDARKFLRGKMDAARMFIAAINQRRNTLSNVMRGIVELQREFFLHGPENIRPMIYRDLADLIGIDLSTISRVVNGKYVQTDSGVYELRYFFSESIGTSEGGEISVKLVKSRLAELIAAEDIHNPLSDDALTKTLNDEGLLLARRTVAKYREQMGIPVARLRRSL